MKTKLKDCPAPKFIHTYCCHVKNPCTKHEGQWLSVSMVAQSLGLTGQAIRKALKEQRLKGYKTGAFWIIHKDDVTAWNRRADEE